jgi:hypothetical protein
VVDIILKGVMKMPWFLLGFAAAGGLLLAGEQS